MMINLTVSELDNISSVAGVASTKTTSACCASKFALEGLSLAVREEVGQFGINVTIVEPGFFRTDIMDMNNTKLASTNIEDYKDEAPLDQMIDAFHGKQLGNPYKLGQAMTKIATMDTPPYILVAGSDALPWVKSSIEARLQQIDAFQELSRSTDGNWK